jgi:alpha-tubulin suppressor-like RCC1 family protein
MKTIRLMILVATLLALTVPCIAAPNRARQSAGNVFASGFNGNGQLGNGTTTGSNTPVQASNLSGVVAIAGGDIHSLALKSDGTVWAWGGNAEGELGNGTTTDSSIPVPVIGLSGVVAIAGGGFHSVALKSDGTVWALGIQPRWRVGQRHNHQ